MPCILAQGERKGKREGKGTAARKDTPGQPELDPIDHRGPWRTDWVCY